MAKIKRVTQAEKDIMWQLFQQGNSFVEIAKKLNRDRGTVSRYVREREAAVNAVSVVLAAQINN